MRPPTAPLPITDEQRSVLEKLIRSRTRSTVTATDRARLQQLQDVLGAS